MKEKGYIPSTKDGWKIKSGTVSVKEINEEATAMSTKLEVEQYH